VEKIKVVLPSDPSRFWYEWQLTDDEQNDIRRLLQDAAPKEHIERFLRKLNWLCRVKKQLMAQPPRSKVRATRERILADCKAALGHLKQSARGRAITWHIETFDWLMWRRESPREHDDTFATFWPAFLASAQAAIEPLETFVATLERHHAAEKKATGRQRADSDFFIRKVRDLYREYIGRPTAYKDGPFWAVVIAVRHMLGLPSKDPERPIARALK